MITEADIMNMKWVIWIMYFLGASIGFLIGIKYKEAKIRKQLKDEKDSKRVVN